MELDFYDSQKKKEFVTDIFELRELEDGFIAITKSLSNKKRCVRSLSKKEVLKLKE